METATLEKKAHEIRKMVLDMCVKAGTGHVNSSMSCTEILVALYYGGVLRYDPKNPEWPDRDRFILSKGQASVILYPILADLGFFPKSDLEDFTKEKGKFGVHLQYTVPGVEITAGSLAIGFGVSAGMALAAKLDRNLYMTVALLGDGELHEGAIWETAMFASHNNLNNLVAIVDRNYLCATDFTENIVGLEPLEDKWKSFGWNVLRINGHDIKQILDALDGFRSRRRVKPLCIICDTVKGKGIDFMSDVPLWHGLAPTNEKDIKSAYSQIDGGKNI